MELTKWKELWISNLESATDQKAKHINDLLQDKITWEQFCEINISNAVLPEEKCPCLFIAISKSPITANDLKANGIGLIEKFPRENSEDRFFYCSRCSQLWREQEISSGHQWLHRLYPVRDVQSKEN